MDEILWKIIILLRKIGGAQVTDRMINSFLGRAYNDFCYFKDTRYPTKDMMEARRFFAINSERVINMLSDMEDEKSNTVLKKVIRFRQSHDKKDRPDYSRKDQYFPSDIIQRRDDEVFIDCGAYDGDSIRSFIDFSGNKYNKIVAFEPDPENLSLIKKSVNGVKVVQAAAWNENGTISFSNGNASGSGFDKDGKDIVQSVKIDDIKECSNATFIKMDIEGAEYNALLGAEKTIRKNKPTLAICIYHSDEDILRIYELIKSWDLGYVFYVRHHAQKISETVLYAIQRSQ